MSTEATDRRTIARRSRPSVRNRPQFLVTLNRIAQKTSDHTMRLATISQGEARAMVRKYSGSSPHRPYAPKPWIRPVVRSAAGPPAPAVAVVVAVDGVWVMIDSTGRASFPFRARDPVRD